MLGLVLEGGGVKGAYHIGVLKALREVGGYDFDAYVGTSIGAINSAMLAAGNWDRMLEMWNNINVQNTLDMSEYDLNRVLSGKFDTELITSVGKTVVADFSNWVDKTTDRMRAYFKNYIDEDAIRKSSKEFGLVTFSVPDFEPHYMMKDDIPEGQIYEYVMASSAYPVFKWQKIDGMDRKWFIDGGVYDNMPIKMLIDKGYSDIVVIRTNIKKYRRKVDTSGINVTYFIPSEKMDFAIKFTRENVEKYMEMGYYDAKRLLMKLPGKRYDVYAVTDKEFYKFLNGLNHEGIIEIVKENKLKPHRHHDANLEDFCDIIKEEMGLPSDTCDSTAFIEFTELFASLLKVNRFRFYKFDELFGWTMLYGYEESKNYGGDITEVLKHDRTVSNELKDLFVSLYNHYKME